MAIVLQNAGKQGFFVISGRNSGKTTKFSLLFMQNKPNFQKAQMNVNPYNTTDYENKWQRRVRKNKPNTNPIKPNFQKAKMNINSIITKDYRKKDDFEVRINKPNSRKTQNERKRFFTKGL